MLKIRTKQMDAFEAASGGSFEDHLVEHIHGFTPYQAEALGDEGIRRVIRYGMERADNYGFTMRGPSRFYVEMMFLLGSDFDTDPQYPWAFEILSDFQFGDEIGRADALHVRLMEYAQAAATPEMVLRSLRAAREFLDRPPPPWEEGFEEDLLQQARAVYPEKYEQVGEAPLRVLIDDSEHRAAHFGMDDGAGITLLFALAYAVGHGFAYDPQFPWIADSIERSSSEERYNRLLGRSKTYLSQAIENLGTEQT